MKKVLLLLVLISLFALVGCDFSVEDENAPKLVDLKLYTSKTDSYFVGDSFEVKDYLVKGTFDDGSESQITDCKLSIEDGYEFDEAGKVNLKASYKEFEASMSIEVRSNIVFQAKIPVSQMMQKALSYVVYTFNFNENNNPNNNFLIVDSKKSKFTWKESEDSALTLDFVGEEKPTCSLPETIKSFDDLETTTRFTATVNDVDVSCANKRVLTAIEIASFPTKTEYLEKQPLDLSGLTVLKVYSDGVKEETKAYVSDTPDKTLLNEIGVKTITVKEKGFSASFFVNILKAPLSSIEVKSISKTSYIGGETLDLSTLVLSATYENDDKKEITEGFVSIPGDDYKLLSTDQIVTVFYTEDDITKTTTFDIEVSRAPVESISVKQNPDKLVYIEDTNLELEGLELTVNYENGETLDINSGFSTSLSDGDVLVLPESGNKKDVEVSYTENGVTKTTSFEIEVNKKTLTGISISKKPNKLSYPDGESISYEGMVVEASYDNGKEVEVTNYTTDPVESSALNLSQTENGRTDTVTVTYSEGSLTYTDSFEITIARPVKDITLETLPSVNTYIEGVNLSLDGLKIVASYDNDNTAIITSGYSVSLSTHQDVDDAKTNGLELPQSGNTVTITVAYAGKEKSFDITVNKKKLTGLSLTSPTKTTYIEDQDFELSGMVVTASYDNGKSETVTSGYVLTPSVAPSTDGPVEVSYTKDGITKTASFNVHSEPKVLLGITVSATKTTYNETEKLDSSKITVKASFNNSMPDVVLDSSSYTITPSYDTELETSDTSFEVSYTYCGVTKTDSSNITVKEDQSLYTLDINWYNKFSKIAKKDVLSIETVNTNTAPKDAKSVGSLTGSSNGRVIGYYTTKEIDSSTYYRIFIVVKASKRIYAPVDSTGLFSGFTCPKFNKLDISLLSTENVTSMKQMFHNTGTVLYTVATFGTDFKTSNVTIMSGMFDDFEAKEFDFQSNGYFDTSNVTKMDSMFKASRPIIFDTIFASSGFTTKNVTDMSYMFNGYYGKTLNLVSIKFNTSNVITMENMFGSPSQLDTLSIDFDCTNVKNMSNMFYNTKKLVTLNLGETFNRTTGNVTNMSQMFYQCGIGTLSLRFKTSSVTTMFRMFYKCKNLTVISLDFNTSSVEDVKEMFYSASSTSPTLLKIIVGEEFILGDKCTSSTGMFMNCKKLEGGNGTKYDSNKLDKTYAVIDGKDGNKGYFTAL